MNNQNQPPKKDELDELNNGCFGLILATGIAFTVGIGVCLVGVSVLNFAVWMISSFLVPIVVWFGVIIWFYSRKK